MLCYVIVWVLKALWIVLSETIHIFRKLHKMATKIWPLIYVHVYTLAPSSGHILLNLYLPFKLNLTRFEVAFLMSGVRMLHFLKDLWKFIWIHQYYTMALTIITLFKALSLKQTCFSLEIGGFCGTISFCSLNFSMYRRTIVCIVGEKQTNKLCMIDAYTFGCCGFPN